MVIGQARKRVKPNQEGEPRLGLRRQGYYLAKFLIAVAFQHLHLLLCPFLKQRLDGLQPSTRHTMAWSIITRTLGGRVCSTHCVLNARTQSWQLGRGEQLLPW